MKLHEARALGIGTKVIDLSSGGYAGPFGEGTITAIAEGPNGWIRVDFPDAKLGPFLNAWCDPLDLDVADPTRLEREPDIGEHRP
jgi:hypothetical protein